MTVLACLVLAVATWFLLVSPRLANASQVREQAESSRSANDALELQIAQLKAQYAELPEKRAELAAIQTQMPESAAMPDLVRSLDQIAGAAGVSLDEVTPATAVVLAPTAGTGQAAAGQTASGSGEADAAATDAAATPGATPVATGPTVIAIPISISVTGDYFETVAFLKKLQTEIPRVALVDSIKVTHSDGTGAVDGVVALHISGSVFALRGVDGGTEQGTTADAGTASDTTSAEGASTS